MGVVFALAKNVIRRFISRSSLNGVVISVCLSSPSGTICSILHFPILFPPRSACILFCSVVELSWVMATSFLKLYTSGWFSKLEHTGWYSVICKFNLPEIVCVKDGRFSYLLLCAMFAIASTLNLCMLPSYFSAAMSFDKFKPYSVPLNQCAMFIAICTIQTVIHQNIAIIRMPKNWRSPIIYYCLMH